MTAAAIALAIGLSGTASTPTMRPALNESILRCEHYPANGFDGAVRRKRLHAYSCLATVGLRMEVIGAYLTPTGKPACHVWGTFDPFTRCLTMQRVPVRPEFAACGGPRWSCCDDTGECVGGDGAVPQ